MHVTYPIFMAFTNSLLQMIKNLVTGDMNLNIYINVAIIKLRVYSNVLRHESIDSLIKSS